MTWIGLEAGLATSAAAGGLILTPLAMRCAKSFGLVDRPNVRKVHKAPVPRVGGVAIALATTLPLLFVMLSGRLASSGAAGDVAELRPVATLLIGALSLAVIGLLDDVFDLSSKYKLLAMLVAAGAFCAAGGAVRSPARKRRDSGGPAESVDR